jgi:zinc protease
MNSIAFRALRPGRAWGCALLLAFCLVWALPARAALQEHRLANGLRVLVQEDRRAPVVVSMVWYRAGSMDEFNGTTGVAHVLEHMMFKGTSTLAPGEFSRMIARAGGRENAFTNRDYTAYYQQLHKSKLSLALKLEADRMRNLALSEQEFAKEIKVVMEERRLRTDDQPKSLLFEAFMSAAYTSHPYRTPVVGWMNDLENLRVDDARAWYGRWYAPNNATLIVVGDVTAQEVFAEAEKQFAAIPARALQPRKPQAEPAQRGPRRVTVKAPAELPYVLMGWHVPVMRDVEQDWEPYALWVLAAVLDGNDAARLTSELVRGSRLAVSAGGSYDSINRGPGLFYLDATPSPGHTGQELEATLRGQVERIAREGVTEAELRRVKAQVVSTQVFQLDSMFSQAMLIGTLDNAGLPPDSFALQARKLQEVTAEQVQSVARKYFVDDNLTVAVLDPQPLAERASRTAPAEQPR